MVGIMGKKKDKNGLERAKATEHVLVDVGTLSGAVTGAVAGSIAGAPGVILGAGIGAALGAAAGEVLDRESHRQDAIDRKLDEDIGVVGGNLGAAEAARASFAGAAERAEAHRRALEAELEEVDENTKR